MSKKYTMIVTSEDSRYPETKSLSFFAENPWEGMMEDIVTGECAEELCTGDTEGLFYQLYEAGNGKRIGYGVISLDALADDITEWEKRI